MYRDKFFWGAISVVTTLLQILGLIVGKQPPPELTILFFISIAVVTILTRLDFLLEKKQDDNKKL